MSIIDDSNGSAFADVFLSASQSSIIHFCTGLNGRSGIDTRTDSTGHWFLVIVFAGSLRAVIRSGNNLVENSQHNRRLAHISGTKLIVVCVWDLILCIIVERMERLCFSLSSKAEPKILCNNKLNKILEFIVSGLSIVKRFIRSNDFESYLYVLIAIVWRFRWIPFNSLQLKNVLSSVMSCEANDNRLKRHWVSRIIIFTRFVSFFFIHNKRIDYVW